MGVIIVLQVRIESCHINLFMGEKLSSFCLSDIKFSIYIRINRHCSRDWQVLKLVIWIKKKIRIKMKIKITIQMKDKDKEQHRENI